jgi:hypothetical protein
MIIYDLFAGTGSSTKAFADNGHTVITFELDPKFNTTETVSVLDLNADNLVKKYGRPDFIWASPPCTAFSIAGVRYHWESGGDNPIPKSALAVDNQKLVIKTLELVQQLNPTYGWLMENPRGMLRKLPIVEGYPLTTITYCQYGDHRMKPTDLWGYVEGWLPRPMCSPGANCHEASPRGSRTGTQGMANSHLRSMVPYALSEDILEGIQRVTTPQRKELD